LKVLGLSSEREATDHPGSNNSIDPHTIITATLQSVGLLKK
jgi:hypothetical protein